MTIMIESSRTFLWTEYARGGCGTLHSQGTDPKVWDKLPVCFFPFYFTFLSCPSPSPPSVDVWGTSGLAASKEKTRKQEGRKEKKRMLTTHRINSPPTQESKAS
jgi:hypothetical protein